MAGKTGTWLVACAAALALAHAAACHAADATPHKRKPPAKKWQSLDNCHYVERDYNDGDSFGVHCGHSKFILRLYFVDAPEITADREGDRVHEQMKYFGATFEEVLGAGHRANDLSHKALGGAFVVQTKKASAPGRSKEQRVYGLVRIGDRYLHELLLVEGLGRVKGVTTALPDGTPSRAYLERLRALENQARIERKGAWAHSSR
jgi:endonuclease YncB( thermonuclease family)